MRSQIALTSMVTIAEMCSRGLLVMAGMTPEDFKKLTGSAPWLGADRNRICQHFYGVLFGTTDAIGLDRFKLPAEWIAGGIAMFVHPTNLVAACKYFENNGTAESLMAGSEVESVTASRLLSLVLGCKSDPNAGKFKILFERNTGLSLEDKINTQTEKKV